MLCLQVQAAIYLIAVVLLESMDVIYLHIFIFVYATLWEGGKIKRKMRL